jgi:hypothetical protein
MQAALQDTERGDYNAVGGEQHVPPGERAGQGVEGEDEQRRHGNSTGDGKQGAFKRIGFVGKERQSGQRAGGSKDKQRRDAAPVGRQGAEEHNMGAQPAGNSDGKPV